MALFIPIPESHTRRMNSDIDILAFTIPKLADNIPAANDTVSTAKYQGFLESVRAACLYEEFSNPDQLAAAVSAAISNYQKNHGELGRRLNPFTTWERYFERLLDPHKHFNHTWSLVPRSLILKEKINSRWRGYTHSQSYQNHAIPIPPKPYGIPSGGQCFRWLEPVSREARLRPTVLS